MKKVDGWKLFRLVLIGLSIFAICMDLYGIMLVKTVRRPDVLILGVNIYRLHRLFTEDV